MNGVAFEVVAYTAPRVGVSDRRLTLVHSRVVPGVKEMGYFLASIRVSPPGPASAVVSGLRRDSPLS
jgi:hypothetical protein